MIIINDLDLYNYHEFMEKILHKVFRLYIKQNVFIVELKHILGMLTDDNGDSLSLEQELKIFYRV